MGITSRLSSLGLHYKKDCFHNSVKNVAQHAYLDPITRVIYNNISPFTLSSLGRVFFFSAHVVIPTRIEVCRQKYDASRSKCTIYICTMGPVPG